MRDALLRSTPFRLTLVLGTAFVVALGIAGLIAFTLINSELSRRMDQSITDTFNVIAQAYGDNDQSDLLDSVRSHAGASLNGDHVYALAGAGGAILAGNASVLPKSVGWTTVSKEQLHIVAGDDDDYRVFVDKVGDNLLLVGTSFAETADIARLALSSIVWASAVILAIVLAAGISIAVRAQRRIDDIAEIMTRIGHGELTARIPVGTRGDDIDMLARQVNVALERLAALIEGMRQVSVNIAHDLKTPLSRLAITLDTALTADASGKPVGPQIEQAQLEIQQISATFEALLRIAQIEAGARRARFVPIRIADVLDKIADVYADVAEEREQKLNVTHAVDLSEIEGDRELLVQLCANLVENSIRHSPAETQIDVSARRDGDEIVVKFSDDGPGIATVEHDKVFQRLYRVEMSRTTPGNGLGLSLVKAIADLHKARIAMGNNDPGLWIEIRFPTI